MSTISLMAGLGLIFKDTFPLFGFTATEAAIIINTNLAFGMLLGLINGPLLCTYGYRKMAVVGSLLYSIGVTATAFVKSFTLIMIFYGICASLGLCLTLSSFSYALNSYFTTKRGRALSLALTIVGLGPIVIPQVTTFLLPHYGFQGTILLYGAFSLHSLVGSLLLQPLKWHTKIAKKQLQTKKEEGLMNEKGTIITDEKIILQDDECSINSLLDIHNIQRKRKTTMSTIDHDAEIGSIYGFDIPLARQFSESLNGEKDITKSQQHLHRRFKSIDTVNLGSSVKIFEEKSDFPTKYSNLHISNGNNHNLQDTKENELLIQKNETKTTLNTGTDCNEKSEKKSVLKEISQKLIQLFDLDLLRDPIYVNMMVGMSVAIFAEANFSQLTPFILTDMNLSTKEISTIMSLTASTDLVFRTLAPFLGEWFRQPPRIMYMFSLCLLIMSRSSLIFVDRYTSTLFVAVGLGASKGIRSVYMSLVIPDYVPIDRLPNASGIQMIVNGVILLTIGPMLGT
ncbi:Monocarboxylate transporter 2 [Dufourea novaeangliae]|uniref:Monocarboxylate transporter 2 n=1 Tax=Dufourea novaeangliae TaxID=178035 RepID=A0A154P8C8_DUFNO|nr:Monocarboxylate transporter 2 [Dufourea novaeangliae]